MPTPHNHQPDEPQSTPMHRAATGAEKRKASCAKGAPAHRRRVSDSDGSDLDGAGNGTDNSDSSDEEYHGPTSDSEGEEVDNDDSDEEEEEDWMATTTATKATKKRAKAAPPKQTSAGGGGGGGIAWAVAPKRKGAW